MTGCGVWALVVIVSDIFVLDLRRFLGYNWFS